MLDALLVLSSVTAEPVTGFVVPVTYPLQDTVYPVDGVAVAFTVSPYFTVSVAFDDAEAVTLFDPCVTVSILTVPLAPLLAFTLYVFLLNHI